MSFDRLDAEQLRKMSETTGRAYAQAWGLDASIREKAQWKRRPWHATHQPTTGINVPNEAPTSNCDGSYNELCMQQDPEDVQLEQITPEIRSITPSLDLHEQEPAREPTDNASEDEELRRIAKQFRSSEELVGRSIMCWYDKSNPSKSGHFYLCRDT